jgi:TonB family protein
LIAGAAVLLVSAGVAGGAWFFRNGRPSASTVQAVAYSPEQSVPLPPVTTDQEAALPSQQDTAAESNALQSAVVASSANGQPNVPAAQPAAAGSPSEPLDEQPGGQPRITATPQPTRRPSMAIGKLSAPVAKTSDVGTSVEAPVVAGQINGLADSSTLGNGLNGEAPRPSAPIVPTHTGGQIQPAKPLTTVAPTYPLNATGRHIEGVVTIDAGLDSTGRVISMKVLSGPPELRQAAMNALLKWKYQPAMLDGQAIGSDTVVNLNFHLPKH